MGRVDIRHCDNKGKLKQKRIEHNYITLECFTSLISALNGNAPGVGPLWSMGMISSVPGTTTANKCIINMNGVTYYEYAPIYDAGVNERATFNFSPAYDCEIHNISTIVWTAPVPQSPVIAGTVIGMFLTNSSAFNDQNSLFYSIIPFKTPMIGIVTGDNIYFDYSFSLIDGGS
jgi:hypothetical protein